MNLPLEIVLLALYVIIILLHSIGCYLLLCLRKDGKDSIHQLYLINLSIAEGLGTSLGLITIRIPNLLSLDSPTVKNIQKYISIVFYSLLTFIYYCNMFFITIDKLMYIMLNIRYPVYWNERKTKVLLAVTWLVGMFMWLGMTVATYLTKEEYDHEYFKYFYPTLDFLFILVFTASYTIIFSKFKKTRMVPTQIMAMGTNKDKQTGNIFKIFRNSRFYVSVLLILTFMVFCVLPDLTYLFYGIINDNGNDVLDGAILILFLISYLIDAIIYIFIETPVRRLLWKKLVNSRWCFCISPDGVRDDLVTTTTERARDHTDVCEDNGRTSML